MKDNYIVDVVKAMATEAIKKFGYEDLLLDNNIYYCNGNDGTDFDWEDNDKTCEFMLYNKNEWGLMQAFMRKDGSIQYYVYDPVDVMEVIEEKEIETGISERVATHIKNTLMDNFDNKDKWDVAVSKI